MKKVVYRLSTGKTEFTVDRDKYDAMCKKHPNSFVFIREEDLAEVREAPTEAPVEKVKPAPGAPKGEKIGQRKRGSAGVVKTPRTPPAAPASEGAEKGENNNSDNNAAAEGGDQ